MQAPALHCRAWACSATAGRACIGAAGAWTNATVRTPPTQLCTHLQQVLVLPYQGPSTRSETLPYDWRWLAPPHARVSGGVAHRDLHKVLPFQVQIQIQIQIAGGEGPRHGQLHEPCPGWGLFGKTALGGLPRHLSTSRTCAHGSLNQVKNIYRNATITQSQSLHDVCTEYGHVWFCSRGCTMELEGL